MLDHFMLLAFGLGWVYYGHATSSTILPKMKEGN
jgi:hypothetical protein